MLNIEINEVRGEKKYKVVSLVDKSHATIDRFRVPAGLAQEERLVNHHLYGVRIQAANQKAAN